eukprot:COSAG01_NODE_3674_length_5805_cov_6.114030_2_plen_210_part_00
MGRAGRAGRAGRDDDEDDETYTDVRYLIARAVGSCWAGAQTASCASCASCPARGGSTPALSAGSCARLTGEVQGVPLLLTCLTPRARDILADGKIWRCRSAPPCALLRHVCCFLCFLCFPPLSERSLCFLCFLCFPPLSERSLCSLCFLWPVIGSYSVTAVASLFSISAFFAMNSVLVLACGNLMYSIPALPLHCTEVVPELLLTIVSW